MLAMLPDPLPLPLTLALRAARAVAVLTGAGVSAESGVPTFRDPDGLWAHVRPEEIATPEAFARDPERVWRWYASRRQAVAAAAPNAAHRALAALEARVPRFTLITQNVDGLHARAGSRNVIELHGCLRRARCHRCRAQAAAGWEAEERPPACARCGGPVRPDVVWFGEDLAARDLHRALDACVSADVVLVVGTSGLVEPAASLAFAALDAGARVVEVNPEPTPLTDWAHDVLAGAAGVVLPEVVAGVVGRLIRTKGIRSRLDGWVGGL